MKVICEKDSLMKGLNIVMKAVASRSTMDILKCVLLNAEGDELVLTANDTSMGIETRIEADIHENGSVAIDAALFSSIVRKLSDDTVMIESDPNDSVTIRCGSTNLSISGRGTEEFVYLPEISTENSVGLSQFTLREMINRVIFSIADSDANAAMSGVYVEIMNDRIRMTTLDGHRISIRVSELKKDFGESSAIIPGKTLSDISKIIVGDSDSDIRILFSKNHVVFEFEKTRVVSRLIEGAYFRVESMLREEWETHIRLKKKDLFDCLDRSTLLVNENDKKPVIMTISEGEMNVRLKSAIGSLNEDIDVEREGKDLKIAFNPKLMMDSLRVIDDEYIDIYMVKYNYPCTIKDNDGSYSYVVLPVNFSEA